MEIEKEQATAKRFKRLFALPLIALSIVHVFRVTELSAESPDVAAMSGTAVTTYFDTPNYWRRLRGQKLRPSHWVSATFSIDGEKCTEPEILHSFGVDNEKLLKALQTAAKNFKNCRPSDDGSGIKANRLLLLTELMVGSYGYMSSSPKDSGLMISAETVYPAQRLDESISDCEDRCTPMSILATMFAKANYYDAIAKPVSASLWRYEALRAASLDKEIVQAFREKLGEHVRKLYNYALMTHQTGLVLAADYFSKNLLAQSDIAAHIDNEASKLRGKLREDDQNIEVVVPLVATSPYASSGGAIMVFLSHQEFSLHADAGEISAAYLQCLDGEVTQSVQLQTEFKSRWLLPAGIGTCRLFVFGSAGAQIRFVQYARSDLWS